MYVLLFSFPPKGEAVSWVFLPTAGYASLGEEVTWLKCDFSYFFNVTILGFELVWGNVTSYLIFGVFIKAFWIIYCC